MRGSNLTAVMKGVAPQSLGCHSFIMRLDVGIVKGRHFVYEKEPKQSCEGCLVWTRQETGSESLGVE